MALSEEEFERLVAQVTLRLAQRKPVTAYGNPRFTGGKPVELASDGLIDPSLLPAVALSTDADTLDGLDSTAFALAAHVHSGADITTGTVADARIASTIARDSEVAAAYATISHVHDGSDITTGTVADARIASTIARDSEVAATYLPSASYTAADVLTKLLTVDTNTSGLNADTLDGLQGAAYALATHTISGHSEYSVSSWTPSLTFAGAAVSMTYSSRSGIYIKLGRLVVAGFILALSAKGSSVGDAAVLGMPSTTSYLPQGNNAWGVLSWANMSTALVSGGMQCFDSGGTHALVIIGNTAAATTQGSLNNTHFGNTTTLRGSIAYVTQAV
jgi:hypothetical protein